MGARSFTTSIHFAHEPAQALFARLLKLKTSQRQPGHSLFNALPAQP